MQKFKMLMPLYKNAYAKLLMGVYKILMPLFMCKCEFLSLFLYKNMFISINWYKLHISILTAFYFMGISNHNYNKKRLKT